MSDDGNQPQPCPEPEEPPESGPNLTLLYSLIGVALVLAIGFAMAIVFPFWRRRWSSCQLSVVSCKLSVVSSWLSVSARNCSKTAQILVQIGGFAALPSM